MAKMYGLTGKMSGKYGNAVFRIRRGEQVMAQYNPIVDNPNTAKQVAARGRMKLMSQLGAIYAAIIAIPREGAKTSRNLFTKVNYKLTSFLDNRASAELAQIQLTKSSREMPSFTVTRSNGTSINVAFVAEQSFSRVVWAVVAKNANGNLRVFTSQVVEGDPNVPNTFSAKLAYTDEAIVVYGYAITDSNAKASAAFGDINSPTAEAIAQLLTNRSLSAMDYVATATGGAYLEVGTNDAVSEAAGGNAGLIPERPTIGGYSPFAESTEVIISGPFGATIYFTHDGTNPTAESEQYREPFTITETATIKAIAVVDGISSEVTTRTLVKQGGAVVVVAPVISGTTPFENTTQVTMSAESGADILYTTDGSEPSAISEQYSGPITISATTTFKAKAFLQNTFSAVTTKTFTKGSGGGTGGGSE